MKRRRNIVPVVGYLRYAPKSYQEFSFIVSPLRTVFIHLRNASIGNCTCMKAFQGQVWEVDHDLIRSTSPEISFC